VYYLENKDFAQAKSDFTIALKRNYLDSELVHYNLGIAEINLDNIVQACKEFKQSGEMAAEFIQKYCK
jgi:hypothetical protein